MFRRPTGSPKPSCSALYWSLMAASRRNSSPRWSTSSVRKRTFAPSASGLKTTSSGDSARSQQRRNPSAAARVKSTITVGKDGQKVDARSVMGLMMLGAPQCTTVEIEAEGPDAEEAITAMRALIEVKFGED